MGLEASVRLELAARAGELRRVESAADPSLERYFDGVATKIVGTIKAACREKRSGVLETGTSDVVEFRDRDHYGKRLLTWPPARMTTDNGLYVA